MICRTIAERQIYFILCRLSNEYPKNIKLRKNDRKNYGMKPAKLLRTCNLIVIRALWMG